MAMMGQGMRRRLATGANALFVTLIVLGLALMLVELATVFRIRVDLSADSAATLQPQTVATLEAVTNQQLPIEIIAFSAQQKGAEARMRDRMMRDVLAEFRLRCPSLNTRFVDFDADRLTAEALGVSRYGTVVVRSESDRVDLIDRELFRRKRGAKGEVDFLGEAAITAAIAQILSEDDKLLVVLAGHGEHRILEHGSVSGSASLKVLPASRRYRQPRDVAKASKCDPEQNAVPAPGPHLPARVEFAEEAPPLLGPRPPDPALHFHPCEV